MWGLIQFQWEGHEHKSLHAKFSSFKFLTHHRRKPFCFLDVEVLAFYFKYAFACTYGKKKLKQPKIC